MTAQAKGLSSRGIRHAAPAGFIPQILKVFVQPVAFFRAMPAGQWRLAAMLILLIAGLTSTLGTTASMTTTGATGAASFDLSVLSETATSVAVAAPQVTTGTAATNASSGNTVLMTALVAASGVIVMWSGQALLLSLVTMLRGYSPGISRSFQVAVWASLPLALMLVLRYVHYSTGGTGGSLGLSLLLNQWSDYAALPEFARRVLAVFMSNFTLFWLWNLLLLYLGARHALGIRRFMALPMVAIWIFAATMIPALFTEPQTRITVTPTSTTTSAPATNRPTGTNTTTTGQTGTGGVNTGGQVPDGGQFPGGGTPPTGGGFPPGA